MKLCGACKKPIPPSSPSRYFCSELCQKAWNASRAIPDSGVRSARAAAMWGLLARRTA